MKRETPKEILAASFRELVASTSADRITVRAITENCGYSSATFYRHFRDKYDLMVWDYVHELKGVLMRTVQCCTSWVRIVRESVAFYQERKAYFLNLIQNTKGYDSFVRRMVEINTECAEHCLREELHTNALDRDMKLCARLYVSGFVTFICDWLQNLVQGSPEAIADAVVKSVPSALAPYFVSRSFCTACRLDSRGRAVFEAGGPAASDYADSHG